MIKKYIPHPELVFSRHPEFDSSRHPELVFSRHPELDSGSLLLSKSLLNPKGIPDQVRNDVNLHCYKIDSIFAFERHSELDSSRHPELGSGSLLLSKSLLNLEGIPDQVRNDVS